MHGFRRDDPDFTGFRQGQRATAGRVAAQVTLPTQSQTRRRSGVGRSDHHQAGDLDGAAAFHVQPIFVHSHATEDHSTRRDSDVGGTAHPNQIVTGIHSRAAIDRADQIDRARLNHDLAIQSRRKKARTRVNREQPRGGDIDFRARGDQGGLHLTARSGPGNSAQRECASRSELDRLTRSIRAQRSVEEIQLSARRDEDGTGKLHVAVKRRVVGGRHLHFKISERSRCLSAPNDPFQIEVAAEETNQRPALNPARSLVQAKRALLRFDPDQGQVVAPRSNEAIDHDIVEAGDQDLAVAARAGHPARARGRDAGFTAADQSPGGKHDLVVGHEFPLNGQSARGRDGHIGAGAAGEDVAFDHAVVPGEKRDGGVEGFDRSGHVQFEIGAPIGRDTAVKIDAAVAQDHSGNIEATIRARRRTDIDDRPSPRRVNRVEAL